MSARGDTVSLRVCGLSCRWIVGRPQRSCGTPAHRIGAVDMRSSLTSLVVALVVAASTVCTVLAQPTSTAVAASLGNANPTFSCTGPVHAQAIKLWERVTRPYIAGLIENGLRKGGNVYVLYDAQ